MEWMLRIISQFEQERKKEITAHACQCPRATTVQGRGLTPNLQLVQGWLS